MAQLTYFVCIHNHNDYIRIRWLYVLRNVVMDVFCSNVTYTVLTQVITIIIERLITHAHITVTGEAWLQA